MWSDRHPLVRRESEHRSRRLTSHKGDTIYDVTMSQTTRDVRGAIERLSTRASIRCKDMIRLLEGLGFVVRDGKKTGHKVITHPTLVNFTSASITCGHGRNPQVKPIYVASIRRLLVTHAEGLDERKENRDDDNGESLRLQHHGPGDRL